MQKQFKIFTICNVQKFLNASKNCLFKCIFCVNYVIKCFIHGHESIRDKLGLTLNHSVVNCQESAWINDRLLKQIPIDKMMFNCTMKINIVWNIQLYRDYEKQKTHPWQMCTHSPVKTCLQISIQTLTVISRVCIIAVYSIILHINDGILHVQVSIVVHAEL